MMQFVRADLDDPRIISLLHHHVITARAATAPGSAHALDLAALRAPELQVWALWEADALRSVGALKRLSADHGEVKAMHVSAAARRRGAGRAMLRHLIAVARAEGLVRLSLETGAGAYFAPARALYASEGFVACAAFDAYAPDRNSVFLSRVVG